MNSPLKDSGVEWLGRIPAHWEIRRLALCFREVARPGHEDLPVLSISIHDGISDDELDADERKRKVTHIEDRSKYKRVLPGDLAYNMMRAWQGGLGAVSVEGQVSPAYVVAEPKVPLNTRYVELLLRTPMAIEEMRRFSRGIADFRSRLYWEQFRDLKVCLPPVEEQEAILRDVRKATDRIDALIAKKTRFIDLLIEKRQALISHVVTKGLNANAAMRDSRVMWLGRIPAHWKLPKLRHIATVQTGLALGKGLSGPDVVKVPYLRVANVQDGFLRLEDVATVAVRISDLPRYRLRPNDVLMNEGGDNDKLGRGHIWHGEIVDCVHQNHVFAIRPHGVSSSWLNAYKGSFAAQSFFSFRSKQTTNLASISSSNLLDLPVPQPPECEQRSIVEHVTTTNARIDTLIAKTKRSIDLLREHRTTLITAAVTGKIDLREAA